jgi:hypothetical protein
LHEAVGANIANVNVLSASLHFWVKLILAALTDNDCWGVSVFRHITAKYGVFLRPIRSHHIPSIPSQRQQGFQQSSMQYHTDPFPATAYPSPIQRLFQLGLEKETAVFAANGDFARIHLFLK